MMQTETLEELLGAQKRIALVVMQFSSTPPNLYEIIEKRLSRLGYTVLRGDQVRGADNAMHIWTIIENAELVVVDISALNVNVYVELGVAAAWSTMPRGPKVVLIGNDEAQANLPFNLSGVKWERYELHPRKTVPTVEDIREERTRIERAIDKALDESPRRPFKRVVLDDVEIEPVNPPLSFAGELGDALPREVTETLEDPAVSLMVTLYIQQLGKLVGEELAATVGFPPIESIERGEEDPDRGRRRPPNVREQIIVPLTPWLQARLEAEAPQHGVALLRKLVEFQNARDKHLPRLVDQEQLSYTDQRLLLVGALTRPAGQRSTAEVRIVSEILAKIAARAQPRPEIPYWSQGLDAIRRLTRLIGRTVAPTEVMTIQRIQAWAPPTSWEVLTENLKPEQVENVAHGRLQAISTLGGALFLGHSVAMIDKKDPDSGYAKAGLALAKLTLPGQAVTVPGRKDFDRRLLEAKKRKFAVHDLPAYEEGLRALAESAGEDFVFAMEHPFHFRVLLEVLSDENRRYPAESILGSRALQLIWGENRWRNFVWFREELPAVKNLVEAKDEEGRALAFLQHYISFGRTPHTSSFIRLEYDSKGVRLVWKDWWPADFRELAEKSIKNLPNSVVESKNNVARQKLIGRLWRGEGEPRPEDVRWLSGELLRWDGSDVDRSGLARRIWDSSRWLDLDFPSLAVSEAQTGAWIIQAMRSHRDSLRRSLLAGGTPDPDQRVRDQRAYEQTNNILQILALFTEGYVSDEGDSIGGLVRTLTHVEESHAGDVNTNAGRLRVFLENAREALKWELKGVRQDLGV